MPIDLHRPNVAAPPCQVRFVFVNDRAPRRDASCVLCSTAIKTGYVHVPLTGQFYCDAQCFAGHKKMTMLGHQKRFSESVVTSVT